MTLALGRSRVDARTVAAATLIGLAWGVFCWWGDGWRWTLIRGAANIAGPWLLIAFWAGAQTARAQYAAALGLLSLVAAILGYYGAIEFLDAAQAPNRLSLESAASWAVVAVPVGLACGVGGAAWRGRDWLGTVAVGLLAGALFGEALLVLRDTRWGDLQYMAVPVAEVTLAFALPVALLDRREALRATILAGLSGPLALVLLETVLVEVRSRLGDIVA